MWYSVFFGSHKNDVPWAGEYDHEPTVGELQDDAQIVGWLWGGVYEAASGEAAIAMAEKEFDGMGCVS